MLFGQPFLTAGERFFENTSSCIITLITMLIYGIILNPVTAPLTNPCGWPPTCRIGAIHLINVVGGGKRLLMVMMFVGGGGCVGIPILFLLYKTYGAGVFCSHPNPKHLHILQFYNGAFPYLIAFVSSSHKFLICDL